MKKIALFLMAVTFIACNKNDDGQTPLNTLVDIRFQHSFDEQLVDNTTFNAIQYNNAFGSELSLTKLRYLITNVTFTNQDGIATKVRDYQLVDVTQNTGMFISGTSLPPGTYTLKMRFGFAEPENNSGIYPDLNAASWSVPDMLGGGYHYMQLEGRFIDAGNETSIYAYHTISAVQNPGPDNIREDTSIEIDLGTINIENTTTTIKVNMNISEWFKNPNVWNLNTLNGMLMGNYAAQILMQENGQNVFSLESVRSVQ
tara:strand:- start:16022 stop:16792 length:771 start_codon:yes stop_codon:yes gene_type:complete